MKIAFYSLRKFDELDFCEKYSKKYDIDYIWTSEYPSSSNLSLAKGCDAVSIVPCSITEEFIDELYSYGVKYILCRSIGYDHIPFEYLKSKGMRAASVSYPSNCVADYAIMLILMSLRKINQIMLRSVAQDFSLRGKMGRDISDCTIGVIGAGNIGRTVIKHLSGFGCKILAYNYVPIEGVDAEFVDLDTLYSKSDVITIHVASTPSTYHLINEDAISKMKDNVIIINTARGNIIDPSALIRNLQNGKIAGAGLDVIENENGLYYYNHSSNIINNNELSMLRSFPNVIVTPHTAFYTETTLDNMVEKTFIAADCFLKNKDNHLEIK